MPEKIFDFSTNTNIFPCPEINIDIKKLISRYPDPDCEKLCDLISRRENISAKKILFTNGINEAVFLLAKFLEGRTGIFQPPESGNGRIMKIIPAFLVCFSIIPLLSGCLTFSLWDQGIVHRIPERKITVS
ncbi:MAG: hypothetical protein IKN30_04005, partial [Synergistaceae bacterium]|nr:hypothetical protein [Synergistaceae bacterium]